jgi:ribonuclease HI
MELTAAIRALEALREPCRVELHTDSRSVSDAINKGWLDSWRSRGWRRKDGEIKNPELWRRLADLLDMHEVKFIWVRGHADDGYNNRCDALAVAESRARGGKQDAT